MRLSSKMTAILLSLGLILGACAAEKTPTIKDKITEVGKWRITDDVAAKYANLSTNQARTRFIHDTYQQQAAAAATDADRNRLAAAIYLNYTMLQGKAIPNYCKGMNVDISEFQTAFDRAHQREASGVAKILAAEGTNLDEVFAHFEKKYKTAAKYELMSTGSSYSACTTVKEKPAEFARQVAFSKFHPKIAQILRGIN